MKAFPGKSVFIFPVVALVMLTTVLPVAAHDMGGTDVAVVLDVSRSMRRHKNFKIARDRVIKFVEDAVDPGMNFVLVTFGESSQVVRQTQVGSEADKAEIIKALQELEPSERKTSTAIGIEAAAKALEALPSDPNRKKLLILLTDGDDRPSSEGEKVAFSGLTETYASHFGKDKNQVFWHCFLGDPDAEVADFASAASSSEKKIDGSWDYTKVAFTPHYLKLRPMPVGEWEIDLKEVLQGEDFKLKTPLPGEYEIELSDVQLENAQPGEKIEVSPKRMSLAEAEQGAVLKLKAVNLSPGEKTGIVIARCEGRLMFVVAHFHISFTALPANVAVRPDSLKFGPLARGKSIEKTIETAPDDVAVKVAAGKTAKIVLPSDLPKGVTMTAEPGELPLDKPGSSKLTLSAAKDATVVPGGYSGAIGLAKVSGVTFKPDSLPLAFETLGGRIDVAPADGLDFGALSAGSSVTRELKLVPDEGARASGPKVEIAQEGSLPKGVTTTIEPASPVVKEEMPVKVTLTIAPDAGLTAPVSGAFALKVPDGSASLSTDRIAWKAEPAAGMVEIAPAGVLDFGNVPPGTKSSKQITLTPDAAAAKAAPTVDLKSAGELPKGVSIAIEPATVAVKEKITVNLTLAVAEDAASAGQVKGSIALKSSDGAIRFSAPQVDWKAVASIAVISLKSIEEVNLGEIEIGQSASRTIMLTPNETAAAAKPKLILTATDTPKSDSVTIVPVQAILDKMAEFNVTVKAGDQLGAKSFRIDASTDSRMARLDSKPIKVVYTVKPGSVNFPDAGQLKFEAASGETPHELATAMLATPGAFGDVVKLEAVFDSLPKGMTVEASPQQVSVKEAKSDLRITLVVEGAVPGDYDGVVRFISKSDVTPKEIPVRLSIIRRVLDVTGTPGLWTIKVPALSPRIKGVELPVSVNANRYAAGAKLTMKPEQELPQGVAISMEPAQLDIKEGGNAAILKADVNLKWSLFGISHSGMLDLAADKKTIEVNGGKVGWVVESGGLWIYLIPLAILILLILWYFRPRTVLDKNRDAGGLTFEACPEDVKVIFQSREQAPTQLVKIGLLDKKEVFIGAPSPEQSEAAADVLITNDPKVKTRHAKVTNRRGEHWITAIGPVSVESGGQGYDLQPDSERRISDGDRITMGGVAFKFRDPKKE
ncbi:MAG TPA: VWA domain-containing protein [Candidatus Brocadiia bacterium]|nr:VWA domain-containing protein [Candidatus Brocadiia bacterium]